MRRASLGRLAEWTGSELRDSQPVAQVDEGGPCGVETGSGGSCGGGGTLAGTRDAAMAKAMAMARETGWDGMVMSEMRVS